MTPMSHTNYSPKFGYWLGGRTSAADSRESARIRADAAVSARIRAEPRRKVFRRANSPKFIVRLSVSLKHLGLRRDKGVLKRGGKVFGGGVELEMRRD